MPCVPGPRHTDIITENSSSGHGVLLNSECHIDGRGAEVNMIKFTVQ